MGGGWVGRLVAPVMTLAAGACASLPPAAEVRAAIARREGLGHAIEGVPFVAQGPRECGPAALAQVLRFHGTEATPREIRAEELVPARLGTYTYELALFAKSRGLFARDLRFDCEGDPSPMRRLVALLDADLPVVVLLRRGTVPFRTFHYVAVTGYEDARGLVLYQDGVSSDGIETYADFQDDWHAADHWALAVFPPERDFEFLTADDRLELAALCERRGAWEPAAAHLRSVLAERPEDAAATAALAGAHARLGHTAEAGALFERSLALDPEDPLALNNFALHLLRTGGDLARAETLGRRALEMAPALRAYVEDTIGQILAARGDPDGARSAFESALAATRADQADLRREIRARLEALRRP